MYKIAIVFSSWIIGGAERSLVELLKRIDTERFDVTVYVLKNIPDYYMNEIPKTVKIKAFEDEIICDTKRIITEDFVNHRYIEFIKDIYYRFRIRFSKNKYTRFSYELRALHLEKEECDCAVSYRPGRIDTVYMLSKFHTKNRCIWFHSIYDLPCEKEYKSQLKKVRKAFCVSKDVEEAVKRSFPILNGKTTVIHNFFDRKAIIKKANELLVFENEEITLLTVGRLESVKGQQLIPYISRLLIDNGYNFKWYIIGSGVNQTEIESEIQKWNVQDFVFLLGEKKNPYPYMKGCTVYVQPSFNEGYCSTTVEAKILAKPIVVTDVSGMREQFISGQNGLIVDDSSPEAIFSGIKLLLDHPEVRQRFIADLLDELSDNSSELEKIYDFVENEGR